MEKKTRIYCIEGQWNPNAEKGGGEVEPSVEPILQMLQRTGYWDYARRDCATLAELQFWLKQEWINCCENGSILYFATHGSEGKIWLTSEKEDYDNSHSISLHQFDWLDCANCLVHFSGCSIVAGNKGKEAVRRFMEDTGAACVTGYTADAGWADLALPPAAAVELMLFSSINPGPRAFTNYKSVQRLQDLIKGHCDKNEIFRACGLKLFTKATWD